MTRRRDFVVTSHGSVITFTATSGRARRFLEGIADSFEGWQFLGKNTVAVESRLAHFVISIIDDACLTRRAA